MLSANTARCAGQTRKTEEGSVLAEQCERCLRRTDPPHEHQLRMAVPVADLCKLRISPNYYGKRG